MLTLELVAMAESLERSKKEGQIGNLRSNTYNMVKIGGMDPEIICLKSLKKTEMKGCTSLAILNSGVTGPNFLHQIYAELFEIRMAILKSISECQGYE